jgi:hypothetical protein
MSTVFMMLTRKDVMKTLALKSVGFYFVVPFDSSVENSCTTKSEEGFQILKETRGLEEEKRILRNCKESTVKVGDQMFIATCPNGELKPIEN